MTFISRVTVGVQDESIYCLVLNFSTIFSVNMIEVHYLIVLDFKIFKRAMMLLDLTIKQNLGHRRVLSVETYQESLS